MRGEPLTPEQLDDLRFGAGPGPGRFTRVGPPPEPPTFRLDETIRYDRESGELQVIVDNAVREVIEVRTALAEGVLLEAIVAELRRRGYTVTPPEVPS